MEELILKYEQIGENQKRLALLEVTITQGMRSFVEVGSALAEIKESRLYAEVGFETFEEYSKQRWGFMKSQAYRMIGASEVVTRLSPIGEIPANEGQARTLGEFDPDIQQDIWEQTLKVARITNKPVTAAMIREVGNKIKQVNDETNAEIQEVLDTYIFPVQTYLKGRIGRVFKAYCDDRLEKPAVISREIITKVFGKNRIPTYAP